MQQIVERSVGGEMHLISLGMLELVFCSADFGQIYCHEGPAGQDDFHYSASRGISWRITCTVNCHLFFGSREKSMDFAGQLC